MSTNNYKHEWRPKDWENPYKKKSYKDIIFDINGCSIFEAGASLMLQKLRELDIDKTGLHDLHNETGKDIINGTIVFIPNDEE